MSVSRLLNLCSLAIVVLCISARSSAQSSSSTKTTKATTASAIDAGEMVNGVYRNKSLGLSCKVPEGWVLRTEEMNTENANSPGNEKTEPQRARSETKEEPRVMLAAFSRPPEAKGEDVNGSILIAAESVATYPGLKEAAQYFGPLTEVAKAQGFTVDEEPYEFAIGAKNVVRGDFHKDVGARVMRQSTLAFLSHGYAISITVIGGTEDEVEELVDGVSFTGK